MYRVLHIMGGADAGGIAAVIWNYYKYIDKSKIRFDIALTGNKPGMLGRRIMNLGAECYELPLKSQGVKEFKQELCLLLKREKFDAIHVHENSTSFVALSVAKKMGVPCRIAHAHGTVPTTNIATFIRRILGICLNSFYATKIIGCGEMAGNRVFGKFNMKHNNAYVLPNAIEVEKFSFKEDVRVEVQEELNIKGSFVLGMVGRLSEEKNQEFALQLAKRVHEILPKTVLVMVGEGPESSKLKKIIKDNQMEEYVQLLGKRNDVERIYQAFDVFLLPSWHEGFPVSIVEAMASGIPVVLSDTITREFEFGTSVYYASLGDMEKWIQIIKRIEGQCTFEERYERQKEVLEHNLDIHQTVKSLEKIYLE